MYKNKNIYHATKNAVNGLVILLKERSAQREFFLALAAIALFIFKPNVYTVLLAVLALVLLAVEALNTAIEKICDHLTLELHPEIKEIKDLGAAAVFILVFAIILLFIRFLSPFV
jgi:diacylglycerol kinase (ATP)